MKKHVNGASSWLSAPALAAAVGILCAHSPTVGRAQTLPTLDTHFKPTITGGGGFVSAVEVQTDSKIILAGSFNVINGIARNGMARLNPDGSVDQGFEVTAACCSFGLTRATEAPAPISALALQKDGKVLIGGSFTNINGTSRNGLARLNADGSLDASFDPGAGLAPSGLSGSFVPMVKIIPQPNGAVLVAGYFTSINGVPRSGLARLNANGTVDTTFNPGTALAIGFPDFGPISGLALLPNGQILVAGAFQAFNDAKRPGLARLNADGSLDGSFVPDIFQLEGPPSVDGLALQTDGGIVISGVFYEITGEFRDGLARLKPDGAVDPAFNTVVDTANGEKFRVLGVQPDNKVIVYREINDATGNVQRTIARVNPNGALDSAYAVDLGAAAAGRMQVLGSAFEPTGKLLVVGNFAAQTDSTMEAVLRIDTAGAVDTSFHPKLELAEGFDANVLSVAVQSDAQVVLGGQFTRVDGAARSGLARVGADGTLDASFAPALQSEQARPWVSAALVQPDGKILIGGQFTGINGVVLSGLARLNADGSLDAGFNVGAGVQNGDAAGTVNALALQLDGKVLLGGDFTSVNGQPVPYVGRLNADGTLDTGFHSGVGLCQLCDAPEIRSLGVLSNGVVMVGGLFTRVEGFPLIGLARLRQDGTADIAFAPQILADEEIAAMAVGVDDKTTVAVTMAPTEGGAARSRLVRYNSDGTLDAEFKPDAITGEGFSGIPVSAVAVDDAGRTLIVGQFSSVGAVARPGLARLNTDGTLEAAFGLGAGFGNGILLPGKRTDPLVHSMALESDGGIVVGGVFGKVDNDTRLGAARFQADPGTPSGAGPRLSGLSRNAENGSVALQLTGETGRSYRIEASSDLRNWTAVGSVTGAATPQAFSDPTAKGLAQRFYRAVGL